MERGGQGVARRWRGAVGVGSNNRVAAMLATGAKQTGPIAGRARREEVVGEETGRVGGTNQRSKQQGGVPAASW